MALHKTLIRSAMTYVFPACKFAAEIHLLKLQRIQNKIIRNDYITKLCRKWAKAIQNHEHVNIYLLTKD
jgi:hypothetical protein